MRSILFLSLFIFFGVIPVKHNSLYSSFMPYIPPSQHAGDMKMRKMIAKQLVRTHFVEPWQFRVKVDGEDTGGIFSAIVDTYHNIFDYLAKDLSFGPTEFATETVEAGATVFTFPKTAQPVVVSMTVRDTTDRKLYKWFNKWAEKVVNKDGTFSLPSTYLRKMTIFSMDGDGAETSMWEGKVYPQKMGDIQMSYDGEGFSEFPVTFQQFRSLTKE